MSLVSGATIVGHTTASDPRPHVLYLVEVSPQGRGQYRVARRFSEFVALHKTVGSTAKLPPKRILTTTFVPSAWVDNQLIAERKAGLGAFLTGLLQDPRLRANPDVLSFFAADKRATVKFDLEDALPSTLTRKAALEAQNGLSASSTPIVSTYYPDWAADSNPPQDLNFSMWNIINFAFATPSSSNGLDWDSGATSTLQTLVSAAHSSGAGTKICVSIGGWGGCEYYSQAVSTSSTRTTFIDAIASAISEYDLDGVDLDWEFPDESGAGQPYSSADSANFLSFLQALRGKLGSGKIISAAVSFLPWLGSNGNPLTDVSAYADQLTYIGLMNYDVFGAGSDPGPNAPLSNACNNSSQPQANAQAGIDQWTAANFPASKILLGLPLYGYASQSTATTIQHYKLPAVTESTSGVEEPVTRGPRPVFLDGAHFRTRLAVSANERLQAKGDATAGDLSSWWGQQIPFNQILAYGALQRLSNGTYGQANGYTEGWDNCSDTPFLFDTARTTVVTYDDTYSLGDKATLAKNSGLAGCFTWSLDQDDGTALQQVIRSSLGLSN